MTVREFRVAPSEPDVIKTLGRYSPIAESHGADVVWSGPTGLCGVQRKAQMDLIASVRDNRLGQEFIQMQRLAYRFLVIEGQAQWTNTGEMMTSRTRWTLTQQYGVELSAQLSGVMVLHTRNQLETVSCVEYLHDWTMKPHDTSSLLSRGNAQKNGWGRMDERSFAVHVWSGIPGVGEERAKWIFDAGLKLLVCGVTVEELMAIKGIGKKTAEKIVKSIS